MMVTNPSKRDQETDGDCVNNQGPSDHKSQALTKPHQSFHYLPSFLHIPSPQVI